jgi:lipopolysaccharide transport system ATP-binding protein
MYVRLAFAVAAHLEPEILIIDEVLAVGDAAFQAKCLSKMGTLAAREHRTILFVSHNMAAIRALSSRAILIEDGRLAEAGTVEPIITRYLRRGDVASPVRLAERADRAGDGRIRFMGVSFVGRAGAEGQVVSGEPLSIELDYVAAKRLNPARVILAISLWDRYGNPVALFATDEMGVTFNRFPSTGKVRIRIPTLTLRGGDYALRLQASYGTTGPDDFCDIVENAAMLTVVPGDFWKSGYTNRPGGFGLVAATMDIEAEDVGALA